MLRKHFPEITVQSAGIEVAENSEIPESIRSLCLSWGLEITETVSTAWDSVKGAVGPGDFVICADDQVFAVAKASVNPSQLINLASADSLDFLIPTDPAGATRSVVEQELAKCLVQTIRLLASSMAGYSPMVSEIYIPSREEKIPEAIARALKEHSPANGKKVIFLDFNLRAPDSAQWIQSGTVKNFDEELKVPRLQSGDILQASHEFNLWSQVLLSLQWKAFISELEKSYEVVAVSSPLYSPLDNYQLMSTESLFALLYVDQISVG
jgi:protein-tyrosine-phosphatase